MATVKANWPKALLGKHNCIPVKRNGKYHVRQYKGDVRNGGPRIKVSEFCHYQNLFSYSFHYFYEPMEK